MFVSRIVTCGVVAAAGIVFWSAPRVVGADPDIEVWSSPLYDVTLALDSLPPVLLGDLRSDLNGRPRTFGREQTEVEEIESQDFEGDTFPPEDWATWDTDNETGGPEETYTWGIQDCDVPAESRGLKSAWSVGGGRLGAELLCGGNYDQPSRSWLVRSGIDTSAYPGGIQVNMSFKVDMPRDEAFQICASTEIATTIACSYALEPTPGRWITFRDPIVFDRAGDLDNAVVVLRYDDPAPDGGNIGVYVDDILIEGLTGEAPPTATSTLEPGRTPTPTASRPAPTAPGFPGPRIFLPNVSKNHDVKADPSSLPTAAPGRVDIDFAEDFLVDGTAITPGPRFAYGILQLCSKQSWYDAPIGQAIRRQWYEWDGLEYLPLGGEDLNNTIEVPTTNGFSEQCVQWVDEAERSPVPVPAGRYRVDLFLGASLSPTASGVAEVIEGAPETPVPSTAVPTVAPPTTVPTVEPSPEPGDCFDPIENGDFEAGPGVGWLETTSASDGLIREELPYDESRFSALFGTVLGVQEVLQSRRAIPGRPDTAVESATLRFVLLMITDETPRTGEEVDIFGVCFGGNTATDVECVARATEDTWPEGTWIAVEQDVTDFVVLRDGFTTVTPLFIGQSNSTLTTNYSMDNVELEICLAGGERMIVPIDSAVLAAPESPPYSLGNVLSAPMPAFRQHPMATGRQPSLPLIPLNRLAEMFAGFGAR